MDTAKDIQNKLIVILLIFLAIPQLGSSQDDLPDELEYEVNRIYPYISITKAKLIEARTLVDLNKFYKPSWVRKYISVEVLTISKGKTMRAVSKNDTLSEEQRDIMTLADVDQDILVKVLYMPENTLAHNDPKEINFTFAIDPENEARYPGGQQQLMQYLKDNAIDKIPEGSFVNWDMAAVKFNISEYGEITDVHMFEAYKDEGINELLLGAICNMPHWQPAEYANGMKVKQEFVLIVGSMENCMINLLNIRKDEEQ